MQRLSDKVRAYNREYQRVNRERIAQKQREKHARYKLTKPEELKLSRRRSALKRSYGLSLEEHQKMHDPQAGACAICRVPNADRLVVDHDHKTGAVRALLCRKCNTAVGYLETLPVSLEKYMDYINPVVVTKTKVIYKWHHPTASCTKTKHIK
jgi:hypothetical protein